MTDKPKFRLIKGGQESNNDEISDREIAATFDALELLLSRMQESSQDGSPSEVEMENFKQEAVRLGVTLPQLDKFKGAEFILLQEAVGERIDSLRDML